MLSVFEDESQLSGLWHLGQLVLATLLLPVPLYESESASLLIYAGIWYVSDKGTNFRISTSPIGQIKHICAIEPRAPPVERSTFQTQVGVIADTPYRHACEQTKRSWPKAHSRKVSNKRAFKLDLFAGRGLGKLVEPFDCSLVE